MLRNGLLWLAALLLPLFLAACGDLPTDPPAPGRNAAAHGPLLDCYWIEAGVAHCSDEEPIWDVCDPYHYDCGEDDCIESGGGGGIESASTQSCPPPAGGGSTGGPGPGPGGGGSGGSGSTPICTDNGCDPPCDPARHHDCEQPLTDADTASINRALRDFLRPATAFTDSVAARECAQMEAWFRSAFASGDVFRGAFDSDSTNDPRGSHYGIVSGGGNIHFDPSFLDAANAGNVGALREVAITALHEAAHWVGFTHPNPPTFDAQGRDSYTDAPFHRLNPGPNSCVPR